MLFPGNSLQGDFRLLGEGEAFHLRPLFHDDPAALVDNGIEGVVAPLLVMVVQAESFYPCLQCQVQGVPVAAVAPRLRFPVFLIRIFGIVDEQVGPLGEFPVLLTGAAARMTVGQFVVGQEDQALPVLGEAEPEPPVGVAEGNGGDGDRTEGEEAAARTLVRNVRLDLVEAHREVGRAHDIGQ